MKPVKKLAVLGLTLASVFTLAACGNSNSGASKTYSYVYLTDPDTLDYTNTNRSTTSDVIANLVDGLLENDKYGNLVPSLAEDWTVSKDGLTYTYKLRKGAKWYTSEGEEYAEVKAQDFVTGLKHAADSNSDALPIVQNSIKGLDAYVKGESKDFSTVGVKAIDDYTVQYTLNQPESYWNSKTTMGILFPINEEFLKSSGKDFGTVKPSGILYNGPYFLKSFTSKSSIEYTKNDNYWDKGNVKISDVKLTYFDGSDQEALVRNFKDGTYTQARLYPNSSSYASVQKQYKDNIVYSPQDATSFFYAFNYNRKAYNFTAKTTDAQKTSTTAALLNKDFRQAINFDGLFNVEKAKAEFAKAKEALQAQGVEFPIHLDLPVEQTNNLLVQQANSFKQSVEEALGKDNVVIDVQQMSTENKNNVTYFAETAAQKDYDINIAGWGPDFQDPSTYLNIFDPDKGDMLQNIGLEKGQNADLADKLGLNEFKKLNEDADSEKQDTTARYTKYAAAQAWLTDSSLVIPIQSNGGSPLVMKAVPFTKPYSLVGIKGDVYVFKYREVQNDIVTAKDYKAAEKKWKKEKEKSNAKAQEELADHVK